MSATYKGLTVVFEKDLNEGWANSIADAIKALRGVADVTLVEVDVEDWINRRQIHIDMQVKLLKAFKDEK